MRNTASILAGFVGETGFGDIPKELVDETKRLLLDSLGCAMAGTCTQKGQIALKVASSYGSSEEATIIGSGEKASAAGASFANGELFNALDYDALCAPSGHITPYVLAAPLAVAEWKNASGKDLITAIVLSHEIAQRVSAGLVIAGSLSKKTAENGISLQLPTHGYGVNIFGGIAGAAKISRLTSEKIEQAFGIGASMCPVPTLMQFAETVPASMSKFSPSGWISQAEVTAVLLADEGYTGAHNVFDGEFAFWKSFAAAGWNPEIVRSGIGKVWFFSGALGYKRYPCCGAMHGGLDIFRAIINKFAIAPQDVKEVNVVVNLLGELSLWKNRNIENQIDAQFSAAYVFAVAAHRIEIGRRWQEKEIYQSPKVREFMERVKIFTPATSHHEERKSVVEVVVRDKNTKRETRYTERDVRQVSGAMDDRELYAKFERNAAHMLSGQEVEQVIKTILSLDELDNVSHLMGYFRKHF
ncbi:MAG: MmgE/PrpD family protein [Syntrophales bacterium]